VELIARVVSVRRATPSARIVRVALESAVFSYLAGQAVMLAPEGSRERVPYSIASAPEETATDRTLEFLIKHDGDGRWGSDFAPLRRGARLALSGPMGAFTFPRRPREHAFLFIAGGTGIAPLRSMLRHTLGQRDRTDPRLSVLYSARTPDDFAYGSELRRLARRGLISLVLTATRQSARGWRGGRGRIARQDLALLLDEAATLCFVCGPASMVADVPVILQELGIERTRIRIQEW